MRKTNRSPYAPVLRTGPPTLLCLAILLLTARPAFADALVDFNTGVRRQNAAELALAIESYDRVIASTSSLRPVALYYKAMVLAREGRIGEAHSVLSSIDASALPPTLRRQIETYAYDLERESSRSRQKNVTRPRLQADLSRGLNRNPQIVGQYQSSARRSDQQTQVRAYGEALVFYGLAFDLKVADALTVVEFDRFKSVSYSVNDLTIPAAVYRGHARVQLAGEYVHTAYAGTGFSDAIGGVADYSYRYAQTYLGGSIQRLAVKNLTTNYYYLTGAQTRYQVYVDFLTAGWRLYASLYGLNYAYRDLASVESSYAGRGFSVALSHGWGRLGVAFGFGLEDRAYRRIPSRSIRREDARRYANLQVSRPLTTNVRVFAEGQWLENRSNVSDATEDHAYVQSTLSLGVSATY